MTPRQEREDAIRQRTAREMGKGGRLSLMSAWLAEGRVKMHGSADLSGDGLRLNTAMVHLSVGDVYFDDTRVHYPSERLVAMLALALQAGVDRIDTGYPPGVMPGDHYRDGNETKIRPFK